MDAWWDGNPVKMGAKVREDACTVDYIIRTSPMPPTDE